MITNTPKKITDWLLSPTMECSSLKKSSKIISLLNLIIFASKSNSKTFNLNSSRVSRTFFFFTRLCESALAPAPWSAPASWGPERRLVEPSWALV